VQLLTQQREDALIQVATIQRQNERLVRKVNLLEEKAKMAEASKTRKGKEKIGEKVSGKIRRLEDKV